MLSLEPITPGKVTIRLDGPIARGDAARFADIAERAMRSPAHPEGPVSVTAAIDSPGGDYLEGIALGRLFRTLGCGTLVRSGAKCFSAAATSFLGGSSLGATGGWRPDRTVELGGRLGFHTFYVNLPSQVSLADGIERGKQLTMLLTGYASELRLDIDFILQTLTKGPHEVLLIEKVGQFRRLDIQLRGTERTRFLTPEGAVNASNYATEWRRPITLGPASSASQAYIRTLTAQEFRSELRRRISETQRPPRLLRRIATYAAAWFGEAIFRPIDPEIEALIQTHSRRLQCVERVVQVSGFDYGGGFYKTDCYVVPWNEGKDDLSLTVLTADTGGSFNVLRFSQSGDCLYEVHDPESRP